LTRILAVAAVTTLVAMPATALPQSKRGPSTAAERTRVVEITRRLEKAPFGPKSDDDRVWLMQWIDEVPDVNIRYCPGPLYGLVEGTHEKKAFWIQSLFGMSTYLVEHYEQRDEADWVKVQVAGLESAVTAYQAARRSDGTLRRISALERLSEAKRNGKLPDVVREEMRACDPKWVPIPADAI
jgi:hypothetical protein